MAKFSTKRQMVPKTDMIDRTVFDGVRLSSLIEVLVEFQSVHGENAIFELDIDADGYGSPEVMGVVRSSHLETDKEYESREDLHKMFEKNQRDGVKKNQKMREAQDRKDYVRLKKKFEGK